MKINVHRTGDHDLSIDSKDGISFGLRCAKSVVIEPRTTEAVETGFCWEIPTGYFGLVQHNPTLTNLEFIFLNGSSLPHNPDYPVGVYLFNSTRKPYKVNYSNLIGFLTIVPHPFVEVNVRGDSLL